MIEIVVLLLYIKYCMHNNFLLNYIFCFSTFVAIVRENIQTENVTSQFVETE
jgi:hypothetical protein